MVRSWAQRHRAALASVVVGALVLITAGAGFAENSTGCRAGIARSMRRMAGTGMRTLDGCRQQLNGGADVSCAALPSGVNEWTRQTKRTEQFIGAKCPIDDEPVRMNYPPCGESCDNITSTLVRETSALLEANADALLGVTPLSGGAARCQEAIAKARARVARRTLDGAQKCQRRRDRRTGNADFGAISPECLAGDAAFGDQRRRIAFGCRGVTTGEVGTCDPLPDCVIDAAKALGRELAIATYGAPVPPTLCGDGAVEGIEECDDGNTVATDACTDTCQNARCGDGIVWEGMEECDDGNNDPTDDCDACHLPVCGDGVRAGSEECDDGNTVAGDGCTDCTFDPVACGAGGLLATLAYEDPNDTRLAAGNLLMGYPATLDIPGSGSATSVRQRVTNVSGASSPIFLAADVDTNTDGTDDTLRIIIGTSSPWPIGPMAEIRFDCTAGTLVRPPDFPCAFQDASDAFSNAIDPTSVVCAVSQLESIP